MEYRNKIELLAPAGSYDVMTAAVKAGTDAVYLGLKSGMNARNRAENFSMEELRDAVKYCHARNVKVYLALNILIKDSEMNKAFNTAVEAWRMGVDAIITQDEGFSELLLSKIKGISLHASTQMTVFNLEGCRTLEKVGFSRIVLARELPLEDIKEISENSGIETEIFIHGSLCVSYSGQCLFSSMAGGRSGNRGSCAQPCRQQYSIADRTGKELSGKKYILCTKDLMTIDIMDRILQTKVASLKIEGRMKDENYVSLVTYLYRQAIDGQAENDSNADKLRRIFLRGGGTRAYIDHIKDGRLMSADTPGQRGPLVGNVIYTRADKAFINTLLLLAVGDTVDIAAEGMERSVKISKIEFEGKLVKNIDAGKVAGIGFIDFRIPKDASVFKKIDTDLITYIENSLRKNDLNIEIYGLFTAKTNQRPTLTVTEGSISVTAEEEDFKVEKAVKNGTTEKDILKSLNKTSDTPFMFKKIDLEIDECIYIPLSVINKIRTNALFRLANAKHHERDIENTGGIEFFCGSAKKNYKDLKYNIYIEKPIAYDYTILNDVSYVFLPVEYLDLNINSEHSEKIVLFLPLIDKDRAYYEEKIESSYDKGYRNFLIKNIGQYGYFIKDDMRLFIDHSLNIFNSYTLNSNINKKAFMACLSAELGVDDIRNIKTDKNVEVIGYGTVRIMTMEHCLLSENGCEKRCLKKDSCWLLDERKDRKFRILSDAKTCTTSLYNCDILYMADAQEAFRGSCVEYMRLMFIDETPEFINDTIIKFIKRKKEKGNITYGRYFDKSGQNE